MKFQAPKTKSQTNTNNRNSKFKTDASVEENETRNRAVSVIGISNLDIIWNLVLGIWDFFLKAFDLNVIEFFGKNSDFVLGILDR